MPLTITPETKNSLSITNESKSGNDLTWDEATFTWDNADGTWDNPGSVITKENKNSLTITNETKS